MFNPIRYVRFVRKNRPGALPQYGVVRGNQIQLLEGTLFDQPMDQPILKEGDTIPLDQVKIYPPVSPSKIIGIGLNYKDHAIEQGKPLPEVPFVFLKATSSLLAPGQSVRINRHCSMVHYEGELAVVIGYRHGDEAAGALCKNVSEAEAMRYVAGYTIANDVTDRVIQKAEATFARAKGMDTFCPLGPYLVHGIDWRNKSIKVHVNGQLRQDGSTKDMIHGVPRLVSFISQFMTLLPGDVILTGTPKGVGQIQPGDRLKIEIEDLGVLEHAVERDD